MPTELHSLMSHRESKSMLNQRVHHQTATSFGGEVYVRFDNIEEYIVSCIRESDQVVGCVAWLRSPAVIKALSAKRCNIAVTNDCRLPSYSAMRPFLENYGSAVRKVGKARGKYRDLMHNKFLVFLKNKKPEFVITGSFNLTAHSRNNLENVVCIRNRECADMYMKEAISILNISRPIK